MTDRGTDIDFDFFEEPETQEATTRSPTRAPRRPIRPPGGLTPLLRLVGLIAFAIALVVLLVFAIQSCRDESKRDQYADYMTDVRAIARDSSLVGRQLNRLLTRPGVRPAQVQTELGGLAQAEEQHVASAREVTPPGRLREQHRRLVDALELRASGLRGLEDAFRRSTRLRSARAAGRLLAEPMRRLVASDVLWDDGFLRGSVAVLQSQGVRGVEVPNSTFLRDPELATARGMSPVWQRIRGTPTTTRRPGLHGSALVSVRALPSGLVLVRDQENVVTASPDLAFEVTISNSGESQEVQVKVRLTVAQENRPVRRLATVPLINPGEEKSVRFRNLGQIVQFAERVPVRVEVLPVRGETRLANNSAEYPVSFRLVE